MKILTEASRIRYYFNVLIVFEGYAFSGGGQKIVRVDVSADQGVNWHTAKFTYQTDVKPPRHYSWSLWCCDVPVPKGKNVSLILY